MKEVEKITPNCRCASCVFARTSSVSRCYYRALTIGCTAAIADVPQRQGGVPKATDRTYHGEKLGATGSAPFRKISPTSEPFHATSFEQAMRRLIGQSFVTLQILEWAMRRVLRG